MHRIRSKELNHMLNILEATAYPPPCLSKFGVCGVPVRPMHQCNKRIADTGKSGTCISQRDLINCFKHMQFWRSWGSPLGRAGRAKLGHGRYPHICTLWMTLFLTTNRGTFLPYNLNKLCNPKTVCMLTKATIQSLSGSQP